MIGFVAYRVTSKILGIACSKFTKGDLKTIKPGKRLAISRYVSNKHSIVYKSSSIDSDRITRSELDYNMDEIYPRRV